MIIHRRSEERGHAHHGWLDSKHTFSFADYYDPRHMGVSDLRVINEDRVAPGSGFNTHPHRDMEIISYVLAGEIEHRDNMGFHTVLKPGDVQVMSAGSGILHSEYNASTSGSLHFLQIWIVPHTRGLEPRYDQQYVGEREGLALIVSPDGRDGSVAINQQAFIYQFLINDQTCRFKADREKTYYLQVARGNITINGETLRAGDGATILNEAVLSMSSVSAAQGLLFELR